MTIVMTRQSVVDALDRNLKAAIREDEKARRKHVRDEQEALQRFRRLLKAAMSWDYRRLKRKYFSASLDNRPSCPRSEAERIKSTLKSINLDTRDRNFTVRDNSDLHRAIFWLPPSKRLKQTICDD